MKIQTRTGLILGLTFLALFVAVAAIRVTQGRGHEIFWFSHVSLLLTSIGFFWRAPLILTSAVCGIFVFHLIWSIDAIWWLLTGTFPIGVTYYLASADIADWFATLHHFYLYVFLSIWLTRTGTVHPRGYALTTAVFALLATLSFTFLPETANVNCACAPCPGLEATPLGLTANLGGPGHLLAMILLSAILNFFPVNFLLLKVARLRERNPH